MENYKAFKDKKNPYIHCVGGCNGTIPTEITLCDIDNTVEYLLSKRNLNLKVGEIYFDNPVVTAYVHPMNEQKVSYTAKFRTHLEHPAKSEIMLDEFGRTKNIHWILCSDLPIIYKGDASGEHDVYSTFFVFEDQTIELRSTIY
jgi:hypothetical protein